MTRGTFRPYGELATHLRWFSMFKRWLAGKIQQLVFENFPVLSGDLCAFFCWSIPFLELLFYGFIL